MMKNVSILGSTGSIGRQSLDVIEQLGGINVVALTAGTSVAMKQDQTLYEIRMPKAPTAYVECEFHDNKDLAVWIQDHLPEIADMICAGICDYYGVPYEEKFSVCLGTFESRAAAEKFIKGMTIKEG